MIRVLYLEVPASTHPLVAHLQCATQSTAFFGTKTYHHIFQNASFSSKQSKFVPGMEHEVSDRDSSRMVNNLAILLITICVLSHILCNCTSDRIASVTPEEKGQHDTMAKEEKQALP